VWISRWQPPAVSFSLREALQGDATAPQPLATDERRQRYREYLEIAAQLAGSHAPA